MLRTWPVPERRCTFSQELLLKLVEDYYPLPVDPDAAPEPTPPKGSRSRKGCPVRPSSPHCAALRDNMLMCGALMSLLKVTRIQYAVDGTRYGSYGYHVQQIYRLALEQLAWYQANQHLSCQVALVMHYQALCLRQGSGKRKRAEAVVLDDDDDVGDDLRAALSAAHGCHVANCRTPSPAPAEVPPHHRYGYPGMPDGAGAAFQTAEQEYEAYRQQEVHSTSGYHSFDLPAHGGDINVLLLHGKVSESFLRTYLTDVHIVCGSCSWFEFRLRQHKCVECVQTS